MVNEVPYEESSSNYTVVYESRLKLSWFTSYWI